ncbi:MAG: TerB family tellurite resistance protein [Planctomycetota bacterium]
MSTRDRESRLRHLRNLVVMAMADGQISEREVNLIADRCAAMGLDGADLQAAIAAGLEDDAALELPTVQEEREALLVDLVQMMAADGRLDESEKRLFALAAVKMDITSDDLDRLIDETLRQ